MPEQNADIPAAWAGIAAAGTFIGGVIAALFKCRTKPTICVENCREEMLLEITRLKERADDNDRNDAERNSIRAEIFARLLILDKNVAAILAILDERREHR
jgi:hypothetical protein